MNPKIVILGGGPSALFAWFGAIQMGYTEDEVEIWCRDQVFPPGAFWLHESPIPTQASYIRIMLQGSPAAYSRNQWGEDYPSSWDDAGYSEEKIAYDPHRVIPWLWSKVSYCFDTTEWTTKKILELSTEVKAVIQTFSLDQYVIDQARQYKFPTYTSNYVHGGNTCIYNGNPDVPWVRTTIAFGKYSVEYPASWLDRMDRIKEIHDKVTGNDGKMVILPDLHPTVQPILLRVYGPHSNILKTGRFTTLNRKALSHHTQREVRDFLRGL